jgi:DnaJ-class molecular chaperone
MQRLISGIGGICDKMKVYEPCNHCNGEGRTVSRHPQATIELNMLGSYVYEECAKCKGTGKGRMIAIIDDLSHKKGPTI